MMRSILSIAFVCALISANAQCGMTFTGEVWSLCDHGHDQAHIVISGGVPPYSVFAAMPNGGQQTGIQGHNADFDLLTGPFAPSGGNGICQITVTDSQGRTVSGSIFYAPAYGTDGGGHGANGHPRATTALGRGSLGGMKKAA